MGANLDECIAVAEKARENSGLFFAVDTLEFLHRGGRIGGAQRFIGSALNLKPILALREGRVEGVERIRTKSKAHDRILELVSEQVKGKSNLRIASVHANAAQDAKALLDRNPDPTVDEIKEALAGNLCRCGTYPAQIKAVLEAARKLRG